LFQHPDHGRRRLRKPQDDPAMARELVGASPGVKT
jgi:hypothetical protein